VKLEPSITFNVVAVIARDVPNMLKLQNYWYIIKLDSPYNYAGFRFT